MLDIIRNFNAIFKGCGIWRLGCRSTIFTYLRRDGCDESIFSVVDVQKQKPKTENEGERGEGISVVCDIKKAMFGSSGSRVLCVPR